MSDSKTNACGKCKLSISGEEKGIVCDSCRVQLHIQKKCSGLSPTESRAVVIQDRYMIYFCEECKTAFKKVPLLIRKIDDLNAEIETLKTEVDKLKTQNMEHIFHEINDRMYRSKNLIIYNVPESGSNILEEKILEDKNIVKGIFTKLELENNIDHIKVTRIGRPGGQKPRPIKVIMSDAQEVISAVKAKAKLYQTNYRLAMDQTKMQQEEYKKARVEMEERVGAGEDNLMIRYIRGTPKIVKGNKDNKKN